MQLAKDKTYMKETMMVETKTTEKKVIAQPTEHPHIEIQEGFCGGRPKISSTRLPVWVIVGYHKMGLSDDEIMMLYPYITAAQYYDALSYYYDHKDEVDDFLAQNSEKYWMIKTEGASWRRK